MSDDPDEPPASPHDRGHDRPQSLAGDATIYIHAVSKLQPLFRTVPDKLELEDVRAFQVHLVSTGISWPALNQIVCALRFFYGVTLGEAVIPERIPYAREPRKLPIVLSPNEVVQFLEAVSSLKSRAALTCCYAAGSAGVRSRRSRHRRYRQRARRHPGPARKRGQGSQRDAVAAVARHSARLLACKRRSKNPSMKQPSRSVAPE